MSAAKLMLAGSSILLIRRIMLIALSSSLHPAVGPTLGLVGMIFLIAGNVLIARSYSKKLANIEVSGKGVSIGAGVGNIGDSGSNTEGPAIA